MMMQYAKDITQNHGGKVIKDCVLTVPSSFTQHERMAIYAAADIANLRVLSLIEENTAAALHYGIDRYSTEQYFLPLILTSLINFPLHISTYVCKESLNSHTQCSTTTWAPTLFK